jgi:hypothetical protein
MMERGPMIVCRCEDVSDTEIAGAIGEGARTLNDVKRRTRAGDLDIEAVLSGGPEVQSAHVDVQTVRARDMVLAGREVPDEQVRPPVGHAIAAGDAAVFSSRRRAHARESGA